jgi:hypothetical protein
MTNRLRALALLLCILTLAACSNPRSRAERALRKLDVQTLRMDAARLYKDLYAARGLEFIVLKNKKLPRSFQQLEPLRACAYPDGFSLAFESDADQERGLYIVPLHMPHTPANSATATYEKIADGVYWYSFSERH